MRCRFGRWSIADLPIDYVPAFLDRLVLRWLAPRHKRHQSGGQQDQAEDQKGYAQRPHCRHSDLALPQLPAVTKQLLSRPSN